jgi:hypothetical protein
MADSGVQDHDERVAGEHRDAYVEGVPPQVSAILNRPNLEHWTPSSCSGELN